MNECAKLESNQSIKRFFPDFGYRFRKCKDWLTKSPKSGHFKTASRTEVDAELKEDGAISRNEF